MFSLLKHLIFWQKIGSLFCMRSEFLPVVPMACQWRPKFRHWLPSVTIGTNGMPMFTNGYQWFLPLAANLANNLECRQNYQPAKWRHFQDNNQWKWGADRCKIKEMTTIFSVSVGANTRLSKFKKKIFYFTAANEFHISCILLIFTGFPN